MAKTHDFGPLFVQFLNLEPGSGIHKGISQQIAPPFARSEVWVLPIPFTSKGIAIGWWKDSGMEEDEALTAAIEGHGLEIYDVDLEDEDVRDQIRANVAYHAKSLDEEWEIINALGVES